VVNRVIGGYIRGVLVLALLAGVLVGAGLAALGVPCAALMGVLAFYMEFVPVLGLLISGAGRRHQALHSRPAVQAPGQSSDRKARWPRSLYSVANTCSGAANRTSTTI
jgi:hypothetical protein